MSTRWIKPGYEGNTIVPYPVATPHIHHILNVFASTTPRAVQPYFADLLKLSWDQAQNIWASTPESKNHYLAAVGQLISQLTLILAVGEAGDDFMMQFTSLEMGNAAARMIPVLSEIHALFNMEVAHGRFLLGSPEDLRGVYPWQYDFVMLMLQYNPIIFTEKANVDFPRLNELWWGCLQRLARDEKMSILLPTNFLPFLTRDAGDAWYFWKSQPVAATELLETTRRQMEILLIQMNAGHFGVEYQCEIVENISTSRKEENSQKRHIIPFPLNAIDFFIMWYFIYSGNEEHIEAEGVDVKLWFLKEAADYDNPTVREYFLAIEKEWDNNQKKDLRTYNQVIDADRQFVLIRLALQHGVYGELYRTLEGARQAYTDFKEKKVNLYAIKELSERNQAAYEHIQQSQRDVADSYVKIVQYVFEQRAKINAQITSKEGKPQGLPAEMKRAALVVRANMLERWQTEGIEKQQQYVRDMQQAFDKYKSNLANLTTIEKERRKNESEGSRKLVDDARLAEEKKITRELEQRQAKLDRVRDAKETAIEQRRILGEAQKGPSVQQMASALTQEASQDAYSFDEIQKCIAEVQRSFRGEDWQKVFARVLRFSYSCLWMSFVIAKHVHPDFPSIMEWGVIAKMRAPVLKESCLYENEARKRGDPKWHASCFMDGQLMMGEGGDAHTLFVKSNDNKWHRVGMSLDTEFEEMVRKRVDRQEVTRERERYIDQAVWDLVGADVQTSELLALGEQLVTTQMQEAGLKMAEDSLPELDPEKVKAEEEKVSLAERVHIEMTKEIDAAKQEASQKSESEKAAQIEKDIVKRDEAYYARGDVKAAEVLANQGEQVRKFIASERNVTKVIEKDFAAAQFDVIHYN